MMRYFIFICSLLLLGFSAQAQRPGITKKQPKYDYQKLHFGFLIGVNQIKFDVTPKLDYNNIDTILSIDADNSKGFSLFVITDLRLGKKWNLRFEPGLSYVQRDLFYRLTSKIGTIYRTDIKSIESTIVEFPVLLKWSSDRVNNHRAYLLGGVKYNIDMSSKSAVDDEELFKLKRYDYGLEFGFGWDFYFQYFKFSPQLRASLGFNNLLIPNSTIYTQSLESIKTRAVYITMTFE